MSTKRASRALLTRIARSALAEFGREDLYVAQAPPGMALTERHLELLERLEPDRLDDLESVGALAEVSMLVDGIQSDPDAIKTPFDDPVYLSDVFPSLLANVEFLATPLGAEAQRGYEQAQAALYEDPPYVKRAPYDEFCQLRAAAEKQDLALLAVRQNRAAAESAEEQAMLDSELVLLEQVQREQREALDALDVAHGFRAAEARIAAAERALNQIPSEVQLAASNIDLAKRDTGSAIRVCCSFFPSQLSEANWVPLKLTREDIARLAPDGAPDGGASGDVEDADIDMIEVECQTLVCQRPWFWPALFEHTGWKWRDDSTRPISDGEDLKSDNGLIPAYVHALIFGRNLKVKGRSTAAVAARMRHFSAGTTTEPAPKSFLMQAVQGTRAVGASGRSSAALKALTATLPVAPPAKSAGAAAVRAASTPAIAKTPVPKAASAKSAAAKVPAAKPPTPSLGAQGGAGLAGALANAKRKLSATRESAAASRGGGAFLDPGLLGAVRRVDTIERPALRPSSQLLPRSLPAKWPSIASLSFSVKGRVLDEKGQAVYKAQVTLPVRGKRLTALTGKDGSFGIVGVPSGSYQLSVAKPSYVTLSSAVTVPRSGAVTLTLKSEASCTVRVQLMQPAASGTQAFTGQVAIQLKTSAGTRLENMNGVSSSTFSVPPGRVGVSVTCSGAEKVSPTSGELTLKAKGSGTLLFVIHPAPLLENPEVQLVGFVCRRVARCPAR